MYRRKKNIKKGCKPLVRAEINRSSSSSLFFSPTLLKCLHVLSQHLSKLLHKYLTQILICWRRTLQAFLQTGEWETWVLMSSKVTTTKVFQALTLPRKTRRKQLFCTYFTGRLRWGTICSNRGPTTSELWNWTHHWEGESQRGNTRKQTSPVLGISGDTIDPPPSNNSSRQVRLGTCSPAATSQQLRQTSQASPAVWSGVMGVAAPWTSLAEISSCPGWLQEPSAFTRGALGEQPAQSKAAAQRGVTPTQMHPYFCTFFVGEA